MLCKVSNCDRKSKVRGMCMRHYNQVRLYGKIFRSTLADPSIIIQHGNVCKIELCHRNGEMAAEAIINKSDYELVSGYRWFLSGGGYVGGYINGNPVRLHRLIANTPYGFTCHHKNENPLDNRRKNLFNCSRSMHISMHNRLRRIF